MQDVFVHGAADAEAVMVARSGRRTPFYFTALRVELDGRPHLIGTGLDSTERKQAEEALRRSNAELEQFAYFASRDLREPLRAVVNYAQLIERRYTDRIDANGHEFLHYLVEGARRVDNLIANAIKYGRSDRPCVVTLDAIRQDRFWRIEVHDNGIGIAPEHFERIFMIFQRLHNRERYEGTGIGLAICRKIVEHHGGQIGVASDLDRGSTFFFTMPAVD